jgi:hypothetical protein
LAARLTFCFHLAATRFILAKENKCMPPTAYRTKKRKKKGWE